MSEVQRADPRARRLAVLLVVIGAMIGGLLILVFERYQGAVRDWILSEPERVSERIKLVFLISAVVLSAPVLAFAAYFWTLGVRVVSCEAFSSSHTSRRSRHPCHLRESRGISRLGAEASLGVLGRGRGSDVAHVLAPRLDAEQTCGLIGVARGPLASVASLRSVMAAILESRTISVSIERSPKDVYEFVSNPANLSKWASGLGTSIENVNGEWIARAPQAPVKLRFVEQNAFGVLDHYVSPTPGVEVYIPMRVVSNGQGSEVIFTLFRQPDMSDAQFQEDAEWVQRDLNTLKRLLETEASETKQNA